MTFEELAALRTRFPQSWSKFVIRDDTVARLYRDLALYWAELAPGQAHLHLKPWHLVPTGYKEELELLILEVFQACEGIARECQVSGRATVCGVSACSGESADARPAPKGLHVVRSISADDRQQDGRR